MSLPIPTKLDDRGDGVVLWRYVVDGGTVDVEAATKAAADTAIQAYIAAPQDLDQLAVAISALETLDQSKPATIGDVVKALKAIVS